MNQNAPNLTDKEQRHTSRADAPKAPAVGLFCGSGNQDGCHRPTVTTDQRRSFIQSLIGTGLYEHAA